MILDYFHRVRMTYWLLCLPLMRYFVGSPRDMAIPKTIVKINGTKYVPCLTRRHYGRGLAVHTDCAKIKKRIVYGTVYGDMHYKDFIGPSVRLK